MKTRTIGVVGGLGTETSCSFCFNVNHKVKKITNQQPSLLMDNLAVPREEESLISNGIKSEKMLQLLRDSVTRLNKLNSLLIVIPCNTVHVHIDELRRKSQVPILSIIEETVKECKVKELNSVAVLGSSMTIKEKLYEKELTRQNIKSIVPNEEEQKFIASSIIRTINLEQTKEDKERFLEIIENLKEQGAQAVILGCTDLFLIVDKEKSCLPLINSTEVLENAVVEKLTKI